MMIWGCVDGKEQVRYKYKNVTYFETIESMWNRLSKEFTEKIQIEGLPHLYLDLDDVYIFDSMKNSFVKTLRMVRNLSSNWMEITLTNDRKLRCTTDHPLPVLNSETGKYDRIEAGKLHINNIIPIINNWYEDNFMANDPDIINASIINIESLRDTTEFSYDVTTESDHFDVSGIYSHNCRAFLSPYYERGGFYPEDENDKPVFTGRWNGGVVSLHLPMILAKARKENKDFYEVLDYYMEMIRNLHKRTREYLGELRASINPLMFCEGGAYRGHLNPNDKIKPLLDYVTFSYGITALNELNRLYNGKSIREDGEFPLEVMKHINEKIAEYKKEDHILYAVYGTPAERLCLDGDTKINYKTDDNVYGYKAIKDLTTDDYVYSYNEETKEHEYKKITFSGKTKENADVVEVKFTNGLSVICTPDHPFAIKHFGNLIYKEASLLEKGNVVLNDHNVKSIYIVKSVEALDEKRDVYDIEVEDNHNFFANGALVHNCSLQVDQFRKSYGIIEHVSDKEYVSNSFHCHVSEDMDGIEKQDKEGRFWNYFGGGRIQYVKYPINYNTDAMKELVRRAMKKGFYEGVNLNISYCADCGHEELGMTKCPKCGSTDIVSINRMNGYLAYSRVHGYSRLSDGKMAEIRDRVSM